MRILFEHLGRAARSAALLLLALGATLVPASDAQAQWATSGNNIYNTNTGAVGVGTSTPGNYRLHVFGVSSSVEAQIANFFGSHNILLESQAGYKVGVLNNYHNLMGSAESSRQVVALGYSNGPSAVLSGFYSRQRVWNNGSTAHGVYAIAETDNSSGAANQRLYGGYFEAKTSDTSGGHNNIAYGVLAKGTVGGSTNLNHASFGVVAQATAAAGTNASVITYGVYADATNSGAGRAFGVYSANGENYFGGRVGIGTTAPASPLTVNSDSNVTPLLVTGNNSNVVGVVVSNTQAGSKAWGLQVAGANSLSAVPNGSLIFRQATDDINTVVISKTGDMGVGTATPASKLHVAGNITVDGNINAKYQDLAEWVPSTQKLSAGTVVILDTARDNHVLASKGAYDTRVAGVISAQPGLSLGEAGEGKVLVATTGRVKVKVDATRAPIRIGDLIVTGEAEGAAMKSEPVLLGGVSIHRPGTIIGKALESLEKGTGEILVLLSLQ